MKTYLGMVGSLMVAASVKYLRTLITPEPRTRLWLYPSGGLCNRMRALDSAISFAKTNECQLDVIWLLKDELHCPLERLFEPLPAIRRVYTFNSKRRHGLLLKNMHRKFFVAPWADAMIPAEKHEQMPHENEATELLLKGRSICLQTWVRFYKSTKPFADFKPLPHLQRRIDEQAARFACTVGVHIRRTDNSVAITHSPTALFFEAMDREIDQNADTTFFISTDSPAEEAAVRARYANRVLSYRKRTLDRDVGEGIEDAVVDLYCMSKTAKIIGSYWSSFTTTAGAIGGVETVRVQ